MSRVMIECTSSQSSKSLGLLYLLIYLPKNILEHKSWPDAYVISTFVFRLIEIHLCRRLNELQFWITIRTTCYNVFTVHSYLLWTIKIYLFIVFATKYKFIKIKERTEWKIIFYFLSFITVILVQTHRSLHVSTSFVFYIVVNGQFWFPMRTRPLLLLKHCLAITWWFEK